MGSVSSQRVENHNQSSVSSSIIIRASHIKYERGVSNGLHEVIRSRAESSHRESDLPSLQISRHESPFIPLGKPL